jgi:hypothetical protein
MPEFVSTPLFGGAIVVDLPSNFADVRFVLAHLCAQVRV